MDFLARGADPGSGEDATGVAAGRSSTGDVLASGEVLESGPQQALGESGLERLANDARRWARGADDSAKPWLRQAMVATAALAVTAAVVVLRAAAPTIPLAEEAAAADTTSAPVIMYGHPRMQPPPFDRLPGRTPIPLPSPVGRPADAVRGGLPVTGPAGAEAARDAARLILGRYCRYPQAYQIELAGQPTWREVSVTVLRQGYTGQRRLTTLRLRWTGRAYAWQGWPTELARCA